jgi:hypothetical protein
MYFLALVFMLQLDAAPPRMLAAPTSLAECRAAVQTFNEQYREQLAADEAKASGARFACLKLEP